MTGPARASIFIDGSWFQIEEAFLQARSLEIESLNFGKLPQLLCRIAAESLKCELEFASVHYFGSIPRKDHPDYELYAHQHVDLHLRLKEEGYLVVPYIRNYGGKEKKVDVGLAVGALGLARRGHYSVGIFVLGDQDFEPMFPWLKEEGCRSLLVSSRRAIAGEFVFEAKNIFSSKIIWLEDLLPQLIEKPLASLPEQAVESEPVIQAL